MNLELQLKRDENMRLVAYDDATGLPVAPGSVLRGNPTIGVGRNLSGKGISADEAGYLLSNDISAVKIGVGEALPWTASLDNVRLAVLLNMGFNLGVEGLLAFQHTLNYVKAGNYAAAAGAMLASNWAKEDGARSVRLAQQMRSGTWQ